MKAQGRQIEGTNLCKAIRMDVVVLMRGIWEGDVVEKDDDVTAGFDADGGGGLGLPRLLGVEAVLAGDLTAVSLKWGFGDVRRGPRSFLAVFSVAQWPHRPVPLTTIQQQPDSKTLAARPWYTRHSRRTLELALDTRAGPASQYFPVSLPSFQGSSLCAVWITQAPRYRTPYPT